MLSSAGKMESWLAHGCETVDARRREGMAQGLEVIVNTFYELAPVDLAGGDLKRYDMVLEYCQPVRLIC